ncbi:hypothetical protein Nepgr_020770 [Nepenthes gracilis]|uniref:Arf-GAP domain-containing protein n=1 Tax=Nepenthes gracilis TaxID=150966 RepID=A0AAD3XWE6_NEPGR|nr:hypothetical protein Nepgr_020770 [Nepenthes gracilis]
MASRLKEDEKHEKIIRGLLKQPANRKCINCNSLGPQYVCTTFWTFVCTTCSGIHREFTHRVKSVSMAKFTPQEVSSLQAGGNERAKEIYFKELDPQRHSTPDSSNVDRLRDFIKHVYVDRRYTGERGIDRPPRLKMGDREEPYDNNRADSSQSGYRSPPYDDTYERRHSDKSSPRNDQDNQRHSDYGRSPVRSGVVNDWRREDRFGNGGRSEDRRSADGDSKLEGRSPEHYMASPPAIRPVREILGENVAPLRVGEPPRVNSGRLADGSAHTKRTASSSSLASSNGNPVEIKREDSLIDFDADPKSVATAVVAQTQPSTFSQSVSNMTIASSNNDWACFDNAPESKVTTPSNVNSLESILTQPTVPAPSPTAGSAVTAAPSSNVLPSMTPLSVAPAAAPLVGNSAAFPPGAAAASELTSMLPVNGSTGHWNGTQHQQQSLFPNNGGVSTAQFSSSFFGVSNSQGPSGDPVAHTLQAAQAFPRVTVTAQPAEVKSSGRKELPEDLFTTKYLSFHAPASVWQGGLAPGMGFPVQYNSVAFMPTFPQSTKSSNPFDLGSEAFPAQVATFPSMAPLQAVLPNVAPPTGLVRTSSLGTATPTWMPPQQSSYPAAVLPLAPSFASAMAPGTHMGQPGFGNLSSSRHQGLGGVGNEVASLRSLNPNFDLGGKFTPAPNLNPSLSGNPFG